MNEEDVLLEQFIGVFGKFDEVADIPIFIPSWRNWPSGNQTSSVKHIGGLHGLIRIDVVSIRSMPNCQADSLRYTRSSYLCIAGPIQILVPTLSWRTLRGQIYPDFSAKSLKTQDFGKH